MSEDPTTDRRTYQREYMRQRRAANPEKTRADSLAEYRRHREDRMERMRTYRQSPEVQERDRANREAAARARRDAQETTLTTDAIAHLENIDLAYIAGLIDGEGCIGLYHSSDRHIGLAVTVNMTHLGVLTWLADRLGISCVNAGAPRRSSNHRPTYVVRVSGVRAGLLCQRLLPYLHVKHEQAALAIAFAATLDKNHRLTESERAARDIAWTRMGELNRRGGSP